MTDAAAYNDGYSEGTKDAEAQIERLRKALNRAVGALKEIEACPGMLASYEEAGQALYDVDKILEGY
jgi:hypothetical protein